MGGAGDGLNEMFAELLGDEYDQFFEDEGERKKRRRASGCGCARGRAG